MRVYLGQENLTVGDFLGNKQRILDGIAAAKQAGAECAIFPELALSGYPPEDLLLHHTFIDDAEAALQEIIAAASGIGVIVGLPRHADDGKEKSLRNSAAVIWDGKLLGYQDKVLLPTYDVFDEHRYFSAGGEQRLWTIGPHNVGITICEDIWQHAEVVRWATYHRDPVKELRHLKPDYVVNISASPFSTAKPLLRFNVCQQAARALQCPLVMCNQVGGNDSLIFDGHSAVVDGKGQLKACAKGFQEEGLTVDLNSIATMDEIDPAQRSHSTEDLYNALVLGVRDYFGKQGFTKACLGLSGGIDSAVAACIAVKALGKDNVLGVAMPSAFSSEASVSDAQLLANNLNINMLNIPIHKPYDLFLEELQPYFSGQPFDATEENLQARARGIILMALSNKQGYIVLSTGNKSELAVGYTTLYGDMAGGLGVITDVSKGQVYQLAQWLNRNEEVIPNNILVKPPSAELRPDQKDSDTLPPYETVDTVLKEYVEEFLDPYTIAEKHQLSQPLVEDIIRKIHLNEYKRRQGPIGLRVTEKAFSIGRRFPIVQRWVT